MQFSKPADSLQITTEGIFQGFERSRILVVGDTMLDTYLWGDTDRISPEAPVPVVAVSRQEDRLGGAANVALNVCALKATSLLATVIGTDSEGDRLLQLLKDNGIDTSVIIRSKSRKTTRKTRVISRNQQMLRYDIETPADLNETEEKELLQGLHTKIAGGEVDAVVLQDYNKGVLSPKVIESVIGWCKEHNIPTAVDPKKANFFAYKNATLFKPNLKEVREAFNLAVNPGDDHSLQAINQRLNEALNNELTLITLSEKGIFVSDHVNAYIFPAAVRNIADVSGAGDTVISVAALCLATGLDMQMMAQLANTAGGLVCEEVGVTPVSPEKFRKEVSVLLA